MMGVGGFVIRTYREEIVANDGAIEIRTFAGDGHGNENSLSTQRLSKKAGRKLLAQPEEPRLFDRKGRPEKA